MKDWWVSVVLAGLVTAGLLGGAATFPSYAFRPLPAALQDQGDKRGFWDKRADLPYNQEPPQVWEAGRAGAKRGFGSLMPPYLLKLYRANQPLLNPSDLFSTRPTSERGKSGLSHRG